MTTTNNKNKTLKKASNLNENKNTKQVITKTENIEICPQKSPENPIVSEKLGEQNALKDKIKAKIAEIRFQYATKNVLAMSEVRDILASIEQELV